MQTITLQVDDGFLPTLRNILKQYPKSQVSIKEDKLSAELERRIKEIDDGSVAVFSHTEVMAKAYEKWENKCKS
jgi:hypothetical protein